jgi:2-oxoglutarate dehydrogenase complex dehydrogenase (E1) component-like enzyme
MYRLAGKSLRMFSKGSRFYHPPGYSYDAEHHQAEANKLHHFIGLYRKHGHHFAQLDPLKLYNKYDDVDAALKNS